MNNIIITNPDGTIYYCKNNDNINYTNCINHTNTNTINHDIDNINYNRNNFVYYGYQINAYCGFIKIIILIDLLIDFNIYKYYNYYNCNNYIDIFVDLIAFYSVTTFNKNLFIIYLIKYYFIIILSLNLSLICNLNFLDNIYSIENKFNNSNLIIIYNNSNINTNDITKLECLYINITTFTNLIILSILQQFYNNMNYYRNIYNTILN